MGYIEDVVVVSPACPSMKSGYGIAILTSVKQYAEYFRSVKLLVLNSVCNCSVAVPLEGVVSVSHLQTRRLGQIKRFVRSLRPPYRPAVTQAFTSKAVSEGVVRAIENAEGGGINGVIVEDVPLAIALMDRLKKTVGDRRIAVRSHNVLGEIFAWPSLLSTRGFPFLWRWEIERMRRWERGTLRQADAVWAITDRDCQLYRAAGVNCEGVVGVWLDGDHWAPVEPGATTTVVWMGTLDLRKRLGIEKFLRHSWPEIRNAVPEAELVAAGRGTEMLNAPASGVRAFGFVEDDRPVWSCGRIAINPQVAGSGLKIKSAIAMFVGKALVSSSVGLQGIPGRAGEHYLAGDEWSAFGQIIVALMKDNDLLERVARAGREIAREQYSLAVVRKEVQPMLRAFAARD